MADPALRFGVLGPLTLERDGQSVAVPGGHQRSLLALMLMAGGVPLTRDRLIDELWGEHPPATAVSALHVHLSKLRDLLGDLLVRDPAGYALTAGGFELDSWEFDGLVEDARADPAEARALLVRALELVRGEPLCDVPCEGSIAQWRRALEEKHLQALLLRIDTDLAAGKAGELLAELELLASLHPYEERAWGQLMLALYRAGRQADALDAYARARREFAAELGLEPGEQLTRLQARILDRDPSLLLAGAQPGGSVAAVAGGSAGSAAAGIPTNALRPRSNLPRPVARLVAREPELAVLQNMLLDPTVRLVTMIGPGGVGKTRLALELARRVEEQYRDGAVFVRLERLTDPAGVADEIAEAIGERDGGEGLGADGLEANLRGREMLIVLDNFEHLLTAAGVVAELLERAPTLTVIASSRAPLRIRGERWFAVEPLAGPAPGVVDPVVLAESPAVALFRQTAEAAGARFEATPEWLAVVADICRALDGLPLAIELAASRSRVLSAQQIHEQLPTPLAIGERALRDLPDRQQTLRGTIAWSYDLLSPGAQAAFRAAGAFVGGFTSEALDAAVASSSLADLEELIDASLVVSAEPGRFRLLELIRAFARDALAEAPDGATVRGRVRHHYADWGTAITEGFDAGRPFGPMAEAMRADHANLRAAVTDAAEAGESEIAARIALSMRPLWATAALFREAAEITSMLLDRFAFDHDEELALLSIVSSLQIGSSEWAHRLADRAAEYGDRERQGLAIVQIFNEVCGSDLAEMERIRPLLQSMLATELSPRIRGYVLYSLSGDAYVFGRYQEAVDYVEQVEVIAEELDHAYMRSCAADSRLLAQSAATGRLDQTLVARFVTLVDGYGLHSLMLSALTAVARYAAGIDAHDARRMLGLVRRITLDFDPGGSLSEGMIVEAGELLGLTAADLDELAASTGPIEAEAALEEARAWITARDPGESVPRERVALAGP